MGETVSQYLGRCKATPVQLDLRRPDHLEGVLPLHAPDWKRVDTVRGGLCAAYRERQWTKQGGSRSDSVVCPRPICMYVPQLFAAQRVRAHAGASHTDGSYQLSKSRSCWHFGPPCQAWVPTSNPCCPRSKEGQTPRQSCCAGKGQRGREETPRAVGSCAAKEARPRASHHEEEEIKEEEQDQIVKWVFRCTRFNSN